jgi:hypothetical protein
MLRGVLPSVDEYISRCYMIDERSITMAMKQYISSVGYKITTTRHPSMRRGLVHTSLSMWFATMASSAHAHARLTLALALVAVLGWFRPFRRVAMIGAA